MAAPSHRDAPASAIPSQNGPMSPGHTMQRASSGSTDDSSAATDSSAASALHTSSGRDGAISSATSTDTDASSDVDSADTVAGKRNGEPSGTRAEGNRPRLSAQDEQDVQKVQRLKRSLNFRADRYDNAASNWGQAQDNRGPQPWKWFEPAASPSPAALYLWRQDHCRQYQLRFGSEADRLFYEHFVATNYHPHLVGEILSGQDDHERHLSLRSHRQKDGNAFPNTDEDVSNQMVISRIMSNVVEAICTVSIPDYPEPLRQSLRNRKGIPLVLFRDRDKYQDEWHSWCRLQGTNVHNVTYDYAIYASHNPYSLYHKAKYGEFGSPHPYIPYSITAPKEFEKSQGEQLQQEEEALRWIAERRNKCRTQGDLDASSKQASLDNVSCKRDDRGASVADVVGNAAADAVVENSKDTNGTSSTADSRVIPISVPDEVMIDQEVEQPQAMGGEGTSDSIPAQQACQTAQQPAQPAQAQQQAKVAAATSHTHPITVSVIVPQNLNEWIRRAAWSQLQDQPQEVLDYLCNDERQLPCPKRDTGDDPLSAWSTSFSRLQPLLNLSAVVTEDEMPWRASQRQEEAIPGATLEPQPVHTAPQHTADTQGAWDAPTAADNLSTTNAGPRWSESSLWASPPDAFKVGNLFLSSCPGKKVRLNGAVRGRGAVCRDLAIDLKRFKDLGVGTLVCCLSDAELETIGVKWDEYLCEADKLGLDLIRIPIVEGNCPTSQAGLDPWLNEIVLHCTLKGINVLVHCRGGVGRAGTLAACWLIKMGLADEFSPEANAGSQTDGQANVSGAVEAPRRSPSQEIMWQCLQVVRLRRSTKAIETAEQAAYVCRYGEYILQRWTAEQQQQRQQSTAKTAGCKRKEKLLQNHRALVGAFWRRLDQEAQGWIEAERQMREERQAAALDQVGDEPAEQAAATTATHHDSQSTTVPAAAAQASQWSSNINSRHAAQLPASTATSTASLVPAATATVPSAKLFPTDEGVTGSFPVTPASTTSPTEENDLTHGRSAETTDEPQRKRRNTNTLSVAEMRLDDAVLAAIGGDQAAAANGHADAAAPGHDLDVQQHQHHHLDDVEMDAFPVNGR